MPLPASTESAAAGADASFAIVSVHPPTAATTVISTSVASLWRRMLVVA